MVPSNPADRPGGAAAWPGVLPTFDDPSAAPGEDQATRTGVILVELFGGMLVAHAVLQRLGVPILASFHSETDEDALTLQQANCPGSQQLGASECLDLSLLRAAHSTFPEAPWICCGGPPCTDVSVLKPDRLGSVGAEASKSSAMRVLHEWLVENVGTGRFFMFMECTRMSPTDRLSYDAVFNCAPVEICARHFSPISRPVGGGSRTTLVGLAAPFYSHWTIISTLPR